MANEKIRLVYGGGSQGLMGEVAAAVNFFGGEVIGVVPSFFTAQDKRVKENLIVVDSMHARKQTMYSYADAFVVLPGGIGTLEEAFEAWTWLQLGIHEKPIGFLNINNFFDSLIKFIGVMKREGFVSKRTRSLIHIDHEFERLITKLGIRQIIGD